MKVGDLVKPRKPAKKRKWMREKGSLGIVAEVIPHADDNGVKQIFVRWFGHSDWSCEYSDLVEVISESR